MDNESSTEVGADAILASLGDSIIDAVRAAMGGKSKASGNKKLSVVDAIEVEEGSVRLAIDSGVNSCKISVGQKPGSSRQLSNCRQGIIRSRVFICQSRGTIEISRSRRAKDSLSSSWVRRWNDEAGLSEPSSPLSPEATLRLVIERLDAVIEGLNELMKPKRKGETLGFMLTDLFYCSHCVRQMKGAVCGNTTSVLEKRKRGSAETMEGLRVSAGEDGDEYVEVLEKLKKMGWSENNDEDSEYLQVLKKMKNLME